MTWQKDKHMENKLIRMNKLWTDRIIKHKLQNYNADYVLKKLWDLYPTDRNFLLPVGYSLKKRVLSREYVGKLLRKIKEGGKT